MGGPAESSTRHSEPSQAQSCVGWVAAGPVAPPEACVDQEHPLERIVGHQASGRSALGGGGRRRRRHLAVGRTGGVAGAVAEEDRHHGDPGCCGREPHATGRLQGAPGSPPGQPHVIRWASPAPVMTCGPRLTLGVAVWHRAPPDDVDQWRWPRWSVTIAVVGVVLAVALWRTSTAGPARALRRDLAERAAARFPRPVQEGAAGVAGTFGERAGATAARSPAVTGGARADAGSGRRAGAGPGRRRALRVRPASAAVGGGELPRPDARPR